MKKALVTLMLAAGVFALAACGGNGDGGSGSGVASSTHDNPRSTVHADGTRDFVEFDWYMNYDWSNPNTWGEDAVSRYWREKFQIHAHTSAPDANAAEVLNLRIMADDLPDAIWMDRSPTNVEMTRLGLFYSIDDLIAFGYDNWFNENIPMATQNFHAVDGVNHTIPNWARGGEIGVLGGATGGNDAWMKVTNVWEAVGSPRLETFEDLFDYAVLVRDANLTNHAGVPITPVLFDETFGDVFVHQLFMNRGGIAGGWGGWYGVNQDGTFGTLWNNTLWREAALEANRWYREGLFTATNFTNSSEQFEENMVGGRAGLIWHDHSSDDGMNFRAILGEADPGNSIEVIYATVNGRHYTFLPANGIPHSEIYHQTHGTLGWNGTFITRGANHPGRIFELLSWMLTPLGAVEWTMGPQGYLWDELTPEGFPILHTPPAGLSAAERTEIGLWMWDQQGHSNHVDNAKFAANEMLPLEDRAWVDSMQANIFTPNLRMSNEFELMGPQIDSTSDLGIRRELIEQRFEEALPLIILASTAEEAARIFDETRDFAMANGMDEIQEIYNANWHYNKAQQGGSIFDLNNIRG